MEISSGSSGSSYLGHANPAKAPALQTHPPPCRMTAPGRLCLALISSLANTRRLGGGSVCLSWGAPARQGSMVARRSHKSQAIHGSRVLLVVSRGLLPLADLLTIQTLVLNAEPPV